ncbi:hypothetical protein [Serratia sp. Se-RSBMAAmG]|uniref:hypothetical protein n=1 Tax=Serratia sp. Se-RSBMAAmG TaxID=3043305 RepID=UPI0024AF026A|nr:hypothetical protein [Serratia sp. Se-RSBMAAmG]MDI6976103.1 hypothetical protein [Serratia sp. Se-RSBMAAmG]
MKNNITFKEDELLMYMLSSGCIDNNFSLYQDTAYQLFTHLLDKEHKSLMIKQRHLKTSFFTSPFGNSSLLATYESIDSLSYITSQDMNINQLLKTLYCYCVGKENNIANDDNNILYYKSRSYRLHYQMKIVAPDCSDVFIVFEEM